jgi:hypothetical protein
LRSAYQLVKENLFYVALFGLIAVGFLVLRTRPTAVGSTAELDAMLVSGKPTLIEFFSNT